jgi:LysM repeat protein
MARRLAVLAAVLVMLLGVGFAHGVQGTAPIEYETVTVQPGDTLWSLAEHRYPGEDVRTRVADIQRANGLGDPVLHSGQTLRLPASQGGQKQPVGAG